MADFYVFQIKTKPNSTKMVNLYFKSKPDKAKQRWWICISNPNKKNKQRLWICIWNPDDGFVFVTNKAKDYRFFIRTKSNWTLTLNTRFNTQFKFILYNMSIQNCEFLSINLSNMYVGLKGGIKQNIKNY